MEKMKTSYDNSSFSEVKNFFLIQGGNRRKLSIFLTHLSVECNFSQFTSQKIFDSRVDFGNVEKKRNL